MKQLLPIPADEVRKWWGKVRPSIENVKQHDVEDWLPEDVYLYLQTGTAFLHVCLDDGEYAGCMVTRLLQDANGICMHIWLGEGIGNLDCFDMAKEQARSIGAKYMTFASARPAWERIYKKLGMKRQSLYSCEV